MFARKVRAVCWLTLVAVARAASSEALDLAQAITSYKEKNNPAARDALEKIVAQNPQNAEAFYYLGKIARREKHFEEAAQALEKATLLDPKNAEYYISLGEAYGKMANESRSFSLAQQSCAALEQAVNLVPRSEEARAALIDFCRKAPSIVGGGLQKAYLQADELKALDPAAGTRLLMTLYSAEGKDGEAFQVATETLKDHPDDYGLLFALGRLSATTGSHLDDGETSLDKCLILPVPEGFPDHNAAHFRLGEILQKRGNLEAARKEFTVVLAADPSNAEAQKQLAAVSKKE